MRRVIVAAVLAGLGGLASAQGPWLGGFQELAGGLKPQKQTILGLYVNRNLAPNEYGRVTAFEEVRLGYMGWKVSNDIFNNHDCFLFESEAMTTQTAKYVKTQEEAARLGIRIKQSIQAWVSPEGKILREKISQESPRGNYTIDAIFGTTTVELSGDLNGKHQDMTLTPVGGTVMFDNYFKPMIQGGKVVLATKEFYLIDPTTMGVRKCTATVRGHFSGMTLQQNFKGQYIEVVTPEETQKAYISTEGDLIRVDLPAERYLLIEYLPASRDPLQTPINKVNVRGNGGGGGR